MRTVIVEIEVEVDDNTSNDEISGNIADALMVLSEYELLEVEVIR